MVRLDDPEDLFKNRWFYDSWLYECEWLYPPLKAGPPFPWAVQNFKYYLITLQNAILDCMKHIIQLFIAFKNCHFILDKALVIYMSLLS